MYVLASTECSAARAERIRPIKGILFTNVPVLVEHLWGVYSCYRSKCVHNNDPVYREHPDMVNVPAGGNCQL